MHLGKYPNTGHGKVLVPVCGHTDRRSNPRRPRHNKSFPFLAQTGNSTATEMVAVYI